MLILRGKFPKILNNANVNNELIATDKHSFSNYVLVCVKDITQLVYF